MRIVSVLTALVVAAALYGFLIEREAVVAFARQSLKLEPIVGEDSQNQESAHVTPDEDHAVPQVEESRDESGIRVIAIRSRAEPVQTGVVLRGQTEALRFVDVRSQASGLVTSPPRRKGAFVNAGDALCELDAGTSGANLAEAEARLNKARIDAEATSKLAAEGFATESRKISVLAELEAASAAVERAEKEIERLSMAAPFDGLLESDTAEVGSLLQPGSLCARIIQLNPIKVVGHVSDVEVDFVSIGARAMARLVSGRSLTGNVTFISRSADPNTRTFRVEIEVPNEDLSIRDGSAAEIVISASQTLAHLVPQSALTLNDLGELGVRLAEVSIARFYRVRVVRDTREGAWVTGLPEQADIIVVGHEYVVNDSTLSVVYREADR